MKHLKEQFFSILIVVVLLSTSNGVSATNPIQDKSKIKAIDKIIKSMTLQQKAELLIGTGMSFSIPGLNNDQQNGSKTEYQLMVDNIRKYLPGAAGFSSEYPKIGITSQVLADGPAGLRIEPERKNSDNTYYCTAFPIATVLASTWDTELVYNVGKAMGNEVLEYGADVLLAPGMNIQRDPLCGRNFEYYSEDPLITGKMAAAMVKGIQSNGVGTSIKHFAANNQETNRLSVNTIVSERALREIYLKGFEIAVTEAQPWTVMSSYNKINGVYTSESHDLLTKILRNDWGFLGYEMTDWGGGSDVVAQMNAGNDMIQPGQPEQIKDLIKAVNEGRLDEEVLNRNLSRILSVMLETPKYKGYKYSSAPDLKAHAKVTRQAASDGMVLLENKNKALPISKEIKKIAAFGNASYEFIAGGTGSGDVNEAYTISLIEGLKNRGYSIDADLESTYLKHIAFERANAGKPKNWLAAILGAKETVPELNLSKELANEMANKMDMALITIGRNSGEGGDREAIVGDFYLTTNEKKLIKNVSDAFQAKGKKAIVILNIGGVIETASWRSWPDAVLLAWQPGQEAGNSVVDVLSGAVNPSGKLAVSFPISYTDAPSAKTFPGVAVNTGKEEDKEDLSGFSFMQRVPWEVVYTEGIYVGYRYYNTNEIPVSYEFGYGMSYTDFIYSNLKLSKTNFDGEITVSVDVKNSGSVAGREVVQIYTKAPQGKLDKPSEELKAFGKTRILNPGETETLNFTIKAKDLASFDESQSGWIVEAGTYTIKVGASALNIKLEADFNNSTDMKIATTSKALIPDEASKAALSGKTRFKVTLDPPLHGSVQISPVLPADGFYVAGTEITITAIPETGFAVDACYYSVKGMWGDMYHESPANATYKVIVDKDKNVGASFIEEAALKGFSVIHNVVYAKPGVKELKYDVFMPDGAKDLPCIVIIHGGGWVSNNEDVMRGLARELVRSGEYVVVSIDYRWAENGDGDLWGNTMADLIGDVYGAIAHIQQNAATYGINPAKIALTGDSAGGHLSAAAANMPDKIGAGGFGVTENVFEFRPSYLPDGKTVEQVRNEITNAIKAVAPSYGVFSGLKHYSKNPSANIKWTEAVSPINNIPDSKTRQIPQYLLRGTSDFLIKNEMVQEYADALKAAGQQVEYVQVQDAGHAFFDWKPDVQTKATFAQYGVKYAGEMKNFFDAVFYMK